MGKVLRLRPRTPKRSAYPCYVCGEPATAGALLVHVIHEPDEAGKDAGDAEELYAAEARVCARCVVKPTIGVDVLFEVTAELGRTLAAETVDHWIDDETD